MNKNAMTISITIQEDELKYLDRIDFPDDPTELERDIHEAIYLAWARV